METFEEYLKRKERKRYEWELRTRGGAAGVPCPHPHIDLLKNLLDDTITAECMGCGRLLTREQVDQILKGARVVGKS